MKNIILLILLIIAFFMQRLSAEIGMRWLNEKFGFESTALGGFSGGDMPSNYFYPSIQGVRNSLDVEVIPAKISKYFLGANYLFNTTSFTVFIRAFKYPDRLGLNQENSLIPVKDSMDFDLGISMSIKLSKTLSLGFSTKYAEENVSYQKIYGFLFNGGFSIEFDDDIKIHAAVNNIGKLKVNPEGFSIKGPLSYLVGSKTHLYRSFYLFLNSTFESNTSSTHGAGIQFSPIHNLFVNTGITTHNFKEIQKLSIGAKVHSKQFEIGYSIKIDNIARDTEGQLGFTIFY